MIVAHALPCDNWRGGGPGLDAKPCHAKPSHPAPLKTVLQRYRVCPEHRDAGSVALNGLLQRFCQQARGWGAASTRGSGAALGRQARVCVCVCGGGGRRCMLLPRGPLPILCPAPPPSSSAPSPQKQCGVFHALEMFDGSLRSCRDRLRLHAERRRKGRQASGGAGAGSPASSSSGDAADGGGGGGPSPRLHKAARHGGTDGRGRSWAPPLPPHAPAPAHLGAATAAAAGLQQWVDAVLAAAPAAPVAPGPSQQSAARPQLPSTAAARAALAAGAACGATQVLHRPQALRVAPTNPSNDLLALLLQQQLVAPAPAPALPGAAVHQAPTAPPAPAPPPPPAAPAAAQLLLPLLQALAGGGGAPAPSGAAAQELPARDLTQLLQLLLPH